MRLAILMAGAVLAGATIGQPASATVYTSSAAFQAATSALTIEDYGSYAAGTLVPDGSTLGALTYAFNTGAGLGGVVTDLYSSFSGGSLAAKQLPGALSDADFFYRSEGFTVVFPTAITALGIFSNDNNPVELTLATASGHVTRSYTVYDTMTFDFIGVTSAAPFTTATFTSSSFNIPEIEYGVASAVPELATWAMMILGFTLVGGRLRASGGATAPDRRAIRPPLS
jgi:hypothetical protein